VSIISDLEINGYKDNQLPDRLINSSDCNSLAAEFIVSRTPDGAPVSRIKDDVWNVRMYDPQNRCVYDFSSWCSTPDNELAIQIKQELKTIQIARMYLFNTPRKVNSVRLTIPRKLATLAFNNKISIHQLMNETTYYTAIISSFSALTRNLMKITLSVIRELFSLRTMHEDFRLAPPDYELVKRLEEIFNKLPKGQRHDPQQTKLIPSRIYGELICGLKHELDMFNENATGISALYLERSSNPFYAFPATRHNRSKTTPVWATAVNQHGLTELFLKLEIDNWKKLNSYIQEIKCAAKFWIHLFSGMRDNEARFLPADAYTSIEEDKVSIYVLRGYTSKIAGQNHTETFWVTHKIVEKGINAARSAGNISAIKCSWNYSNKSQYPLFPAFNKVSSRESDLAIWHFDVPTYINGKEEQARLLARMPTLSIREEDICELERFDGFRDWRNDPDVEIGKTWPLATHQCRRSLAVYSARSGLVSVGSMALQFKQLTETMASYYRKGNAFAENFLCTDDAASWMDELEHERRTAQFIDYQENVINSSTRLWGGEGARIQVARDKGQPLIITTDRSFTENKFLKGEMTYKPSPIGGCTNVDHCDKISFTSILVCIDCEKSILDNEQSLKNIKRGMNNLKREQALFIPANPLYKQLDTEINALYEKLDRRGLRQKMEELV
jgi:hypothetical protein